MKQTFTFLTFIFASLVAFSQAPNAMSYQAVIRDANNNLLSNQLVGMQISILQGSANGSSVYTETQTASTNDNGLVSVAIGEGTSNDDFSNIDWSDGPYFIKTETDPTGGSNYTITGTNQLLSVPYAMHARSAENAFSGDYNDLNNKPTNVSAFTNDAGYVTTLNDDDATNELQNISLSAAGDTLYLSNANWIIIPTAQLTMATLTTTSISGVTDVNAISGGNVTNDGGSNVTARGVVWSTNQNPTLSNNLGSTVDGSSTGTFTSNLTGLTASKNYYVRAYATNSIGTAYGNEVSFTTTSGSGTYPAGTVHCNGTPTEIVDVTNPTTGKTWMDRNLGASQVATSSTDADAYGDLYQWGRAADGHQCRNSATTSILSSTDDPGHGDFITTSIGNNYDWRSPQNDNLWQGVSGTNNPCPSGYRLPTSAELDAERASWSINSNAGAFGSPLKLTQTGYRHGKFGSLDTVGNGGLYWSSSVGGANARYLGFDSGAFIDSVGRAFGFSIRCLKD